MSSSQSFSNCYYNNHFLDDSSSVFDADTVVPEEVPSSTTEYPQQPNTSSPHPTSQDESPPTTISELLRRINSTQHPAMPFTNTTEETTLITRTTKPNENYKVNWKSKFQELCVFQQLHGHTNVPPSFDRQLSTWASFQRTEYRNLKQANKKAYITKERIEMLESIGFEWERSKWNIRFTELLQYKETHGHTNNVLSKSKGTNKQLGNWVARQRAEYRKFQKNEKSHISSERIQMLESIGFEWVCPNKGSPRNESAWNERFNELSSYKELHGQTNVPRRWKDNKQLGVWVRTQRKEYKKFKDNKHSCITKERIQMLESIGFEWVCRPIPRCLLLNKK